MLLSYTVSPKLNDLLEKIEDLRTQILLMPLSTKLEIRFRWEALVSRIYFSLILSKNSTSKSDVVKVLTSFSSGKSREEQKVINYKRALDYIYYEWLGSPKPVTVSALEYLYDIISYKNGGSKGINVKFLASQDSLKYFLDYVQKGSENPIIKAGVAYAQLLRLSPFKDSNEEAAGLLSLLFLYKYGYDFRGLLVVEENYLKNPTMFKQAMEVGSATGNLTLWLEYFAQFIVFDLEKVIEHLNYLSFRTSTKSSFFDLNDRQKALYALFQEPDFKITNRKVQKVFKVSQITASRDLAKLASLGLLLAVGKGRSVSYIRA